MINKLISIIEIIKKIFAVIFITIIFFLIISSFYIELKEYKDRPCFEFYADTYCSLKGMSFLSISPDNKNFYCENKEDLHIKDSEKYFKFTKEEIEECT